MDDNHLTPTPSPKGEGDIVRVLRAAAESPEQVERLRRAVLAFVKAPEGQAARAGLLQLAGELDKLLGKRQD